MNRKERTVLVTLAINALAIGLKYWLASASGSLSLRAGAIHSTADLAIGIFVLLGLFIARWDAIRTRTKARVSQIENWIALGVAVAIFYAGYDIVRDVLLQEPPDLQNIVPVLIGALITIPIAWIIARYLRYVGQQTSSPALIASGYHAQLDVYATGVVVAGLAAAALGLPSLDRAAAAVVVVFVLFAGYEIVTSAWRAITQHATLAVDDGSHAHPSSGIPFGRNFLMAATMILSGLYLLSGFYTVAPGEVAVIRRFGRVVEVTNPGPHYRLPWPIDRTSIVAVDEVRRVETPSSLMLTGDENLIAIRLSLHYAVRDPAAFLLNVADPELLARQAGEAAVRQVVAQERVDALLTIDKAVVQQRAVVLAQQILDSYRAGMSVQGIQLLESSPPPEVADAFRDVASAREDRNTLINEALAYRNENLPTARGTAETTIQAANAYRTEKIGLARGEATRFVSRQGAYALAPGVTRLRLYLEAIEQVLPGTRKFILDSAIQLGTTDLWIPGASGVNALPPLP